MIGEGSIDGDELRVDEVFDGEVFFDEGAEEFPNFLFGIPLESFVKVRMLPGVDGDGVIAIEVGPLADEAIAEGLGFWIGEEAVDLL